MTAHLPAFTPELNETIKRSLHEELSKQKWNDGQYFQSFGVYKDTDRLC